MPLVRLTQGPPRSVADFPEGTARSAKGALHLAPGVVREVTDDEAAHLKEHHGQLPLMFLEERPRRRPPAVSQKPVDDRKTGKPQAAAKPAENSSPRSEPSRDKGKET